MRKRLAFLPLGAGCLLLTLVPLLAPDNIPAVISAFAVSLGLFGHAYALGTRCFSRHHWLLRTAMGGFLSLAVLSLVRTLWYYSHLPLTERQEPAVFALFIILAQAILITVGAREEKTKTSEEQPERPSIPRLIASITFAVIAVILSGFVLHAAATHGTWDSIRTPWPLMPPWTLPVIAALWFTLFLHVTLLPRWTAGTAIHSAAAVVATTWIVPLIYHVGFGFDGFLHVASEKILASTGTLTPTPPYYIGQYVFVIWLRRLTMLPIGLIDRWLVPTASALLPLLVLPFAVPRARPERFLLLAFLPLAPFIATTPQSFAYLLGFAALLLVTAPQDDIHPIAPLLLAAWSVATHPLAGIPVFLIVMAALIARRERPAEAAVAAVPVLLAGVSIPLLFVLIGTRGGTLIEWNPSGLGDVTAWLTQLRHFVPWIGNFYVLWPAWTTLTEALVPAALLLLGIMAVILGNEKRLAAMERRQLMVLVGGALTLIASAAALKIAGDFRFLIAYERGSYADRLETLAVFCLLAATPALSLLFNRLRRAPRSILVIAAVFFTAIPTALAYDSLPRHDALVVGHGWSTSAADIDAVKRIDADAAGRDYVVLADQSVSAGAVATLGFKRYAGDVFFYPIPTGGPLYETYLKMTYSDPSRDTVAEAGRLGNASLVYVVINDYWWRADTLNERIRLLADDEWIFDDGAVHVYSFDLNAPSHASTTTGTR